jgi:GNAT superfamily N-acetyltransferase
MRPKRTLPFRTPPMLDHATLEIELRTRLPVANAPVADREVTEVRVRAPDGQDAEVARGTVQKFLLAYDANAENDACGEILARLGPTHRELHEALQANLDEFREFGILGFVFMDDLVVDPLYRHQGLASHVLHRLLVHFDSAGGAPTYFFADARPWRAAGADDDAREAERVRRLLLGAGFVPIGGSPFMAFPLDRAPTPPSATVRVVG